VKPYDTLARETLQLIYGSQKYSGRPAVEVVTTWLLVPEYWDNQKIVQVIHPGLKEALKLDVDQDKARALGVSSQSLAQSSRTILSGSTIGQYREGDKLIDIVLRQPLEEREVITDLGNAYVPTATGRAVPLLQIARVNFEWEPGVLWREGRNYAVTVQGDVAEGMQGATVTREVWPQLEALSQKMPSGYRMEIAGAVEESSKGQGSIAVGVPIMLFITFTLLMLQLHSFSRAMLVFLTGPLGIAGVAAALLLLNRPFGFVALLGVIALMGMIQRNSVILIDQIEQDRRRGVPTWDAIVEAAVRRFRPIVLTAAAAVLAMVPLAQMQASAASPSTWGNASSAGLGTR
jgi:multidrug efflux pump subunit AcrB